jgi:hypothetical protein
VHRGITELADYRSATVEIPPGTLSSSRIGESGQIGGLVFFRDSVFIGSRALGTSPEGTVIDNVIFDNVVFKDAIIIYNGGPLHLRNVRFINCRFKVHDSVQAIA